MLEGSGIILFMGKGLRMVKIISFLGRMRRGIKIRER